MTKNPDQKISILIASDHAGYDLKQSIIKNFENSAEYILNDLGCDSAMVSVDYPDFAQKLSQKIIAKKANFGILICGSGIGISIAANRFKEIRAALCVDKNMAELSRKHNNANVICLGARLTAPDLALELIKTFLTTEFESGRHENRVKKLSQ